MLPANIWLFSPSMKSIRSWLLWLILLYQLTLKGQSYYSSDITTRVYKNLQVALQDPDKVFRLDLSNQELTRIPLEVFTLTYLEVLVLDGNNMQEVTFQIDKLPNLKLLSLKRNKLREFHIPKKCLDNLSELYLDQNQLMDFPLFENTLIGLTTLSLSQNFIKELPREAIYLSRLKFLTLDANPLSNPEIAFTYSSYYERLSMYNTGLKRLPHTYQYKNLTKLVISGNQLDYSSIKASYFPRVEYLDISYNKVRADIDFDSIIPFKSVKYLVAEEIGLTAIPTSISTMSKLREVSFLRNKLTDVPETLSKMKLKSIHLEYNPISIDKIEHIQREMPKTKVFFDN